MQTLDKNLSPASAPVKSPPARMKAILKWADGRNIEQVYSFFRGCYPGLESYELRIRLVLRTSTHSAKENDVPWIEAMEAVVGVLATLDIKPLKAVA